MGALRNTGCLLFDGLDRGLPYARSCHRFADRGSVDKVILLSNHVGFHIDGWNKTRIVSERRDLARPIVGGRAGFHADETWRQRGEEGVHLLPAQLLPQDRIPRRICGVGHENALGNVQSDCLNLTHGWPPLYAKSLSAFGTLMPGAEAIHPIKLNDVDPRAWLADVLAKLPDHPIHRIGEMMPWAWKARQEAAARVKTAVAA